MKRFLTIAVATITIAGCAAIQQFRDDNPYDGTIFYAKYLNPSGSRLDAAIQQSIDRLRANPDDAAVHNYLGMLLVEKAFPKDAEREFERAVNADSKFYPGWYNLALMRSTNGDRTGARRAFQRTIKLKPGHSAALFQLGLLEEQSGDHDAAVEHYAKAFTINRQLLDVKVNPRILDTRLTAIALIRAYPKANTTQSLIFQPAPNGYQQNPQELRSTQPTPLAPPQAQQAPSPQAPAQAIVTPAAPVTDPGTQRIPPPPPPGATPLPVPPASMTPTPVPGPSAQVIPSPPDPPSSGAPQPEPILGTYKPPETPYPGPKQ